jgi:DNA-binding transcriptional ArsR family regulator
MPTKWLAPLRRASGEPIPEDTVFRVLKNRRRRFALHYLKQHEGPVPVGDLAEQVAAWENGLPVGEVSRDERRRAYISLIQTHLPTMEESSMVSLDEDDTTVELTDAAADVDVYVELVPERDIQWAEYYLGLSAFAGLFVLAAHLDVSPLTELPDVAWLGFVSVLFLLSGALHYVYQRRNRLGNTGAPPELTENST